MRLKTEKFGKSWWIVGDGDFGPYGPYKTKSEAEDDRIGLIRTWRRRDEPDMITTDRRSSKTKRIQND